MSKKVLWAMANPKGGFVSLCDGRKSAMRRATVQAQQFPGKSFHVMKTVAIISAPIPEVEIVELEKEE